MSRLPQDNNEPVVKEFIEQIVSSMGGNTNTRVVRIAQPVLLKHPNTTTFLQVDMGWKVEASYVQGLNLLYIYEG